MEGVDPILAGPRPCLCFADRGGLHSLPERPRGNQLDPSEPILTPSPGGTHTGSPDAFVLLVRSLTTVGPGGSVCRFKTSEPI